MVGILPLEKPYLWINETSHVQAEISLDGGATWEKSDPENKHFLSWWGEEVSFVEQVGFNTFYIVRDYSGPDTGTTTVGAMLDPRDGGTVATVKALAPSTQPATFEGEVAAANLAKDRDVKVQLLQRALRPGDDQNLVVEFDIGVLLGQRQPVRERESLDVFEGIVRKYDHHRYYRFLPDDAASQPELRVPRAAILAASMLNGPVGDHEGARKYAVVAMKDLQWTFETRRADWQNQPEPKPMSDPFEEDMLHRGLKARIANWQQQKAIAAAGDIKLLGPYAEVLITAAIRQYALIFGPTFQAKLPQIMDAVVREYPDTPIAKMATAEIDSGFTKIPMP